jgi:energy-coupling factor transporter transmembrane protein EcfT
LLKKQNIIICMQIKSLSLLWEWSGSDCIGLPYSPRDSESHRSQNHYMTILLSFLVCCKATFLSLSFLLCQMYVSFLACRCKFLISHCPTFFLSETSGYGLMSFGIVCLYAMTQHHLNAHSMTIYWSMGEFIKGARRCTVRTLYFIILICWPISIIPKCHSAERQNTRFVKSLMFFGTNNPRYVFAAREGVS